MKIIIPMAGIGKRMRPHTLTIPKPLIKIAGKPIVQRLVEEIHNMCNNFDNITDIGFIIGNFSKDTEKQLLNIAQSIGAKGHIYYQKTALGTAHAISYADELLSGNVIVAFADTLFKANFKISNDTDVTIWTKYIDDPSSFGVVKTDENKNVTGFFEKPKSPISNLAIIGIYYIKEGATLKKEIKYLLDNKIIKNGEYQLTDALENMLNNGLKFSVKEVDLWLDCGNKNATVDTNKIILELEKSNPNLISKNITLDNSIIIEPCFIAPQVTLKNSIIGPFVSVGDNTIIENSIIQNSIIQNNCNISNANITNSMLGNNVEYRGFSNDLSIGDYTSVIL